MRARKARPVTARRRGTWKTEGPWSFGKKSAALEPTRKQLKKSD